MTSSVPNEDSFQVLLVYPFIGGEKIELAATNLPLCDCQAQYCIENVLSLELDHTVGKTHTMTFYQRDFDSLNPQTYVNDTVIDFWFRWFSRTEPYAKSNVLLLTSHFYSTLLERGVAEVSQWMHRRNIEVLSMKLIMLPINLDKHWSFCSIYLTSDYCSFRLNSLHADTSDAPFILHLDSCQLHDSKDIASKVRQWLDVEWTLKFFDTNSMINELSLPLVSPEQGNYFLFFLFLILMFNYYITHQ
jgi:Ulp1 family protease